MVILYYKGARYSAPTMSSALAVLHRLSGHARYQTGRVKAVSNES